MQHHVVLCPQGYPANPHARDDAHEPGDWGDVLGNMQGLASMRRGDFVVLTRII